MKKKIAAGVLAYIGYVIFGWVCFGDEGVYDVINSKGNYIHYRAPDAPEQQIIIVAPDSRANETRWQPMLDDVDLKNLIYLDHSPRSGLDVFVH